MIPVSELKKGHIYKISSRNLRYGVWDGVYGFIGIREKFNNRYLDLEIHWDLSDCHGTARPMEDLGFFYENPWYIGKPKDKSTRRLVKFEQGKGWYFLDTGEFSPEIRAISEDNSDLFQKLEKFEASH